jgi:hypothetical protein
MKKHKFLVASAMASLLFCVCHAMAVPLALKQSKKEFSADDEEEFSLVEARGEKHPDFRGGGRPFTQIGESADGSRTKSIRIGGGNSGLGTVVGQDFLGQHGYRNEREYALHVWMCYADAIVVARAKKQLSYMSKDDAAIYTKTSFDVLEVLKDGAGVNTNGSISVARLGGEVEIDGKHFALDNKGVAPYKKDETYLLWLDASPEKKKLFFALSHTIAIRKDALVMQGRNWDIVSNGTPLADFKADMVRIGRLEACPERGSK